MVKAFLRSYTRIFVGMIAGNCIDLLCPGLDFLIFISILLNALLISRLEYFKNNYCCNSKLCYKVFAAFHLRRTCQGYMQRSFKWGDSFNELQISHMGSFFSFRLPPFVRLSRGFEKITRGCTPPQILYVPIYTPRSWIRQHPRKVFSTMPLHSCNPRVGTLLAFYGM